MIEIRHQNMDDSSATRAAYNRLYSGSGILMHDSFYLWIIRLLRPQPGRAFLDISCGEGRLVALARERGLQAFGVDFAEEAVRMGLADSPHSGWAVADGEQLPLPDMSFDYVTNLGSLEHYQDPARGMREIARVLKPSGFACVLLPNTYGLFGNIKYAWRTGQVFDDGQPLQRYNTRMGWHRMLVANGLMPFQTLRYELEWPRTSRDLGWYLARPVKLMRVLVGCLVPLNLANSLVYLCHRSDIGESRVHSVECSRADARGSSQRATGE